MASTSDSVPSRYVDRLIRTKTGTRLVAAGVFPNAKEVTESLGARQALTRVSDFSPRDAEVVMVSVGDGTTPRTAATFALTTGWQCHSIDPRLRRLDWSLPRLAVHRDRVEALHFQASTVVVVMVHAHVSAATALRSIVASRALLISIPCCTPPGLTAAPSIRYHDPHIGSPKNEVLIWRIGRPTSRP